MNVCNWLNIYQLTHVDCKVACHKCASDLPNTCGLPAELADHLYTQPPSSKKEKIDNGEKRTAVERVQLRKEGWLQVNHAGKHV